MLVLLTLLLLAVVFLPQLLPSNMIKDRVVQQLRQDLGYDVSIDRLEIGWFSGIEIYGVHVSQPQGFGADALLTIQRLWCPFQPIDLLRDRIDQITIENMDVYCVVDAQGRFNLANLVERADSLDQSTEIGDIELRQIILHLVDEMRGSRQSFTIQHASFNHADDGSINWLVQAYQDDADEPTIFFQGSYGVFDLTGQGPPGPQTNLRIDNLDLGRLGLEPWGNFFLQSLALPNTPQLGRLNSVTGICCADVDFAFAVDGTITIDGSLDLTQVNLRTAEPDVDLARDFELHIGLDGSLIADHTEMQCDLDSNISGHGFDIALSDQLTIPSTLPIIASAHVELDPCAILLTLPALAQAAQDCNEVYPNTIVADVQMRFDSVADRAVLSLRTEGPLNLDNGNVIVGDDESVALDCTALLNRNTQQLRFTVERVDWPSVEQVVVDITTPIPALFPLVTAWDDYAQWWRTTLNSLARQHEFTLAGSIAIDDFDTLAASVPRLQLLPPQVTLLGPLDANMLIVGLNDHLNLDLNLASNTILVVRDTPAPYSPVVFEKISGQPLRVLLETVFDLDTSTASNISLSVQHGDGLFEFSAGSAQLRQATTDQDETQLVSLTGQWRISAVEDWCSALPRLDRQLADECTEVSGSCDGDITLQRTDQEYINAHLDFAALELIVADRTTTDTPEPFLHKPQNLPCAVDLTWTNDPCQGVINYNSSLTFGDITGSITGSTMRVPFGISEELGISPSHHQITYNLTVPDLAELTDLAPGLVSGQTSHCDPYCLDQLQGEVRLNGQCDFQTILDKIASGQFNVHLIGDNTSFVLYESVADANGILDTQILWDKQPGSALSWDGCVSVWPRLSLTDWLSGHGWLPVVVQFDNAHGNVTGASLDVSGGFIFDLLPVMLNRPWHQTLRYVDVGWSVTAQHSEQLVREIPLYERISRQWNLSGTGQLTGRACWDESEDCFGIYGALDLSGTAFAGNVEVKIADSNDVEHVEFCKPLGDVLNANWAVGGCANELNEILIDGATITLPGTALTCDAVVRLAQPFNWVDWDWDTDQFDAAEISLSVDCNDLAAVAQWVPSAEPMALNGSLSAAGGATVILSDDLTLESIQFTPWEMTADLGGMAGTEPIRASIDQAQWSSSRLLMSALRMQLGQSNLNVVCDLAVPMAWPQPPVPTGQRPQSGHHVNILAERLDLDVLNEFLRQLDSASPDTQAASTSSPIAPMPDEAAFDEIVEVLRLTDFDGTLRINQLSFTDPKTEARLVLDRLQSEYQLYNGDLNSTFRAALSGGVVTGSFTGNFNIDDPTFEYELVCNQLQATEALTPLVESEFPGLIVTGTISEQRRLHTTLSRILESPDTWLGTGTNDCTQGSLFGPGGPGWLWTVIPGLELVEYPWQRMSNQYELLDGGRKRNHMTFHGQSYNIYIDGVSTEVRDQAGYARAIDMLRTDLERAREQVQQLARSGQEDSLYFSYYQQRLHGLAEILDRYNQGQQIRVTRAGYEVGALVRSDLAQGELFEVPQELLTIPAFYSTSYIIGRHMIGIETTSTQPAR